MYLMIPFWPDPDWYRRYWLDERPPSPARKAFLTFTTTTVQLLRSLRGGALIFAESRSAPKRGRNIRQEAHNRLAA